MKSKITVIHHSADFDGIFCREIARKFLSKDHDVELVGWDFGDATLELPETPFYVMDLPIDRVFGFDFGKPETIPPEWSASGSLPPVVWIDHHKSSIETHPTCIPGFRLDGVAACRLAWQWFTRPADSRPLIVADFIDREVNEPYAVRLAGEHDVWDHSDPNAERFQFGLRAVERDFAWMLDVEQQIRAIQYVRQICAEGRSVMQYVANVDATVAKRSAFLVQFEGLTFMALNTAQKGSGAFKAVDVVASGHDALMKFNWTGKLWDVSLYHAAHRTDLDLSVIAKRHGGGGHRGACGFRVGVGEANALPWMKGPS